MADDEYEMIPHKLLADLKYDVETLQKRLTQPDSKVEELLLELENVKSAVHDLTTVFTKALEEIKDDGDLGKKMELIVEKLDAVVSQNETIARGMVAVADKVDDFVIKGGSSLPQVEVPRPQAQAAPIQHDMGTTQGHGPSKTAPYPSMNQMPQPQGDMDFPPPPPGMRQKRGGLF